MEQMKLTLFGSKSDTKGAKRGGPPNRMNNLVYRDWMKFQKSFFRHVSSQSLVEECIYFFTKSLWPDGQPSRSLIIDVENFDASAIPSPRSVDTYNRSKSLTDVVDRLQNLAKSDKKYDFVMVDLRSHIKDPESLSLFLGNYSDEMFHTIRQLLVPQRYCSVLVGMEEEGGSGFPLPWAVALSCRSHLKLRDEKVGLVENEGRVFYCLFMQANNDERPASLLTPARIRLARTQQIIPGWIIPTPPPRKPNEILHPAKYPETLVTEFIKLFTDPGDNVFDPMVGTGSTVIAAIKTERNGYGVDLIPGFVDIANERLAEEINTPVLFHEPQPRALIIQGDAMKLNEITDLSGMKFNYTITSPPYWSMLTNPGSENQKARRKKKLPLVYSQDERDLGNVQDYDRFLEGIESVYSQVATKLVDGGLLTVIVKNVKRHHILYPLAWDLCFKLCGSDGKYDYLGTTLWCQDDIGLKPFAVGIHWVSNTLHHYCLHFRKRQRRSSASL